MESYQILSHVADVRLKVEAENLENLFCQALRGMAEILKKDFCQKAGQYDFSEEISVFSPDKTALLIDFLSEALTLSYERKIIFCEADFSELKNKFLRAKIFGKKSEEFDEDIKAVTYHEAEVKKNKKGKWETLVVFDI